MSKITQIERALQSLDPASFQRLCDSYLTKRGYERLNSVGLVVGADKVATGTPDTLIRRSDGNYDFAEYSTQQDGLASKFGEDIAKCLDEKKTGVPIGRIHEIILCHNARMTAGEEFELTEQCRRQGVMLSIYAPNRIANDLYQKYPGLAQTFLDICVDTGQIVTADEFVTAYNKRGFATPLDTVFKFREDQLKQVTDGLIENDLVLVSGRPGVGKTRFALEYCDRYARANPDVAVRCIFNKGADLFEDLRVHFSEPGHFLIFVDDANRVSGFEYAVQLLNDQRTDQKIKIIATVRDYALGATQKTARIGGSPLIIELEPFTADQIKELVRDNSSIRNHLYLERIADIAQGNPRLAIMAARIAERENNLQSIADVSALYDEYFESVRNDLNELGDPKLVLAAGIISFFRVIDRSNAEMAGAISDNFSVDADEFWKAAQRLHELEVVDMYEKEIVRITDQVLSTYLFYLAAFRDRALDFGILLERFFPNFRHRLIDALNPVLSAFDAQAVLKELRPHVDQACEIRRQRGDEDGLMSLLDVFWFVKPTDTLIFLQEQIDALQAEPIVMSDLSFVKSNALPPSPSILGILDNFGSGDEVSVKAALSLILDYLQKKPRELSLVIRMLEEHYGVSPYSQLNGFLVERALIDAVWSRTESGTHELFSRLFLTVAEPLLHTHFQISQSKGIRSIAIINFDVAASKSFLDLRKIIWERIFSLYSAPALREEIVTLVGSHSSSGHLVDSREIVAADTEQVLAFFESSLDPSIYSHCLVVQDYLDMLERLGLEGKASLREQFANETYELSELVIDDRRERSELGWREYETMQRQRLAAYTADFTEEDYARFFDRCAEIIRTSASGRYEYQVRKSVVDALIDLADRDATLFVRALRRYLDDGNLLQLGPWFLIAKLIEVRGSDEAYEIISSADYPQRMSWLFTYFTCLPQEGITGARLQQLYVLYESAKPEEVARGMDHLLKFQTIDQDVFIKVTRTLVDRCKTESMFGSALSGLFTNRSQAGPTLQQLFGADVDLLKEAYFAGNEVDDHEDFEGEFFNLLLDLDPNFGSEWISQLYRRVGRPSWRDDSRNYAFIWRRGDFIRVMEQIVDAVTTHGKNRLIYDPYLQRLFILHEGTADIDDLHKHQDEFLDDVIRRRHNEKDLMVVLFEVISGFSPERRRARLETFVLHNKDHETFERLPTQSSSTIAFAGSAVPGLQRRLEFFESLLPILGTVELLRHRQYVEQRIQRVRDQIEAEKRSDFMSDD